MAATFGLVQPVERGIVLGTESLLLEHLCGIVVHEPPADASSPRKTAQPSGPVRFFDLVSETEIIEVGSRNRGARTSIRNPRPYSTLRGAPHCGPKRALMLPTPRTPLRRNVLVCPTCLASEHLMQAGSSPTSKVGEVLAITMLNNANLGDTTLSNAKIQLINAAQSR